ncbi:DUF4863 family protein [Burkholderia sp. Ac-20365]|jgi:hypothetical protein|uniref:DUF4863 family protein n=1 Tax=Burkholderia sp. Ac-20365 TaxID=2703897 RepID=UPI00197C13A8|nr:DUF4863 family protein [Burkholderia sp. Ac-20365]MBN3762690.1 DUF4863 family protein [Burkholderia sp. Ac-20365]
MSPQDFQRLIAGVTAQLDGRPLDAALAGWLNTTWPADSATYAELADACRVGVAEGWLCNREHGGIRYGRVLKPTPDTHGFSVDVVDMQDIAGPHHVHPNGEIDLIMPLTRGATFDGHPAGWCVYGPGSAHRPTVAQGQALVLYLLPQGAIEFTRDASAV